MDERLRTLATQPSADNEEEHRYPSANTDDVVHTFCDGKYHAFCYSEDESHQHFWQVPQHFVFPKVDRQLGWKHWLLSMPDYTEQIADGTTKTYHIAPFHFFDCSMLPKKAKFTYKVNWQPVFCIMDDAITSGDSHSTEMTSDEINYWFRAGTELLKVRVSYCFEKNGI